jgi:ankyrin repeat protein
MLALTVTSMAVVIFCISYFVDMLPFKVMIWFASGFMLFNTCNIGLHPMNNCKNPNGRLAFEYVVNNDAHKLSELLKKTSSSVIYELSYKENTLLHQAVLYERMEIIELLIANYIPVNQQNSSGATAYDTASGNKNSDIINFLKAHGGLPASKLPLKI